MMGYTYMGGITGLMFSIVPIIVTLGFIFVFGVIIVRGIKGVGQWQKNNKSPELNVRAKIVAKRTNVQHYHHSGANNMHHHTTHSTDYYATFEFDSGDRMEFKLTDYDYGMTAEGDVGTLTFKGTRFLGFQREHTQY